MEGSSSKAMSWASDWLRKAAESGAQSVAEARAGKQLLDEGGASAELWVLAKKASASAVSADADFVAQSESIAATYDEAADLLEQVRDVPAGCVSAERDELHSLVPAYRARAALYRHTARSLTRLPQKPTMTPEEEHASYLLPLRAAKAQLGLRPPVGSSDSHAQPTSYGGQTLRFFLNPVNLDQCRGMKASSDDAEGEDFHTPMDAGAKANRTRSAMDWDSEYFPDGTFTTEGPPESHDLSRPDSFLSIDTAGPLLRNSFLSFAESVPLPQFPSIRERLTAQRLPGLTLAGVRSVLLQEPFLMKTVYDEHLKAKNLEMTPWQDGTKEPGTRIRGIKLVMPVPTDMPAAVARLVSVPEFSKMTSVFRLKDGEDEVVLVSKSVTHDVPFGENFRVQEILSFKACAAGKEGPAGVSLCTWVECNWVKAVPWGLGAIKGTVESSTVKRAREQDQALVRVLQRIQN